MASSVSLRSLDRVADTTGTIPEVFQALYQSGAAAQLVRDHLGIGYRFGARKEHDVSFRAQHLSNAGYRNPNPGINLLLLRYQYHLR